MSAPHAPSPLRLTRETLLDGSWHAALRASMPGDVRWMPTEEREAQVADMLARAPTPGNLWVFAFGSLIWNPAFEFIEQRTARVHGYRRQFCLWARAGRGSAERPGLMLSLESGGSCAGVAYRLPPGAERLELDLIWRREMAASAYRPVWTRAHTDQGVEWAVAFTANRMHERHAPNLSEDQVVHHLATGVGAMGRASDYLFDTVAHLRKLGIRDRTLERLDARVRDQVARAAA